MVYRNNEEFLALEAVLFDLDGTLLASDIRTAFIPHYFELLRRRMAPWVTPQRLSEGLWEGTRAMEANDGSRTNETAFAEVFYPYIGISAETLAPELARFYAEEFPQLKRYVQPRPEARQVVQTAFELGYLVAIATNPHFPATATLQRLEWANVHGLPYSKVTSYENCSFAKPNLGYYREILQELGCPAHRALVVGDEAMDMVAGNLGCPTYLVSSPATCRETVSPQPTFEGPLAGVRDVLRQHRHPS